MPIQTTANPTELAAINQILSSCGQAPVTAIDSSDDELTLPTNPDVAIAYNTLMQVSREVQAEGWTFNKEYNKQYLRDVDDEIPIPNDVLQLRLNRTHLNNRNRDGIQRQGKLYDRVNHTYKWDSDPFCDVVLYLEYLDIPTPVRDYITSRASVLTAQRIVGDPQLVQMLQQQEGYTELWLWNMTHNKVNTICMVIHKDRTIHQLSTIPNIVSINAKCYTTCP